MDDAQVFGRPAETFGTLGQLRPHVLRANLWWQEVARQRPANGMNHEDRAYDWRPYDDIVLRADRMRIGVVFTIIGTPGWANGGSGWNRPPRRMADLRSFAFAAAKRYSGTYELRLDAYTYERLPRVRLWTAWNEPNLAHFFRPLGRRYDGASVASAYARTCNAVMSGVHTAQWPAAGEQVACGVTAPYVGGIRPLRFLRLLKRSGARFDAYAHHPHPGRQAKAPHVRPRSNEAIRLGNIDVLIRELTRLYGRKPLWITEYGYETRPPDGRGVSWALQARYLRQAHAIAWRNPRIAMMIWFLLRDERHSLGWQSGLVSAAGRAKPSFWAFRALRR